MVDNVGVSDAFDFAPFYKETPHIRWKNLDQFIAVGEHIIKVANELGHDVIWGHDWDQDGVKGEKGEHDYGHIEYKGKKKKAKKEKSDG
jgi:hypothetical protein